MKRSLKRLLLTALFGAFLGLGAAANGHLLPCPPNQVASVGHVSPLDPGGCGGGGGGCY